MTYIFNNRAVSHITQGISSGDTQIRVPWPDFPMFTRSGSQDYMLVILRGPTAREIVKIDIAASVDDEVDKYLTVQRGQGGTSSSAWPAGTLIFLSTTADHYGDLFQPDSTRQVDFNPNGVISPLYRGEKLYQYAGCDIRWWQSFDAINPYWHLIAGLPCVDEHFEDPGWGFKVWIYIAPACWQSKFNDLFWAPDSGQIEWTGNSWLNDTGNAVILDPPLNVWSVGYRPQLMRISRPVEGPTNIFLYKDAPSSNLVIAQSNVLCGPTGSIFEIPSDNGFTVYPLDADLQRLVIGGSIGGEVEVSGIDFLDCEKEEVIPYADGHFFELNANYTTARLNTQSLQVQNSLTNLDIGCYDNSGLYVFNRAILHFDLSGLTIDPAEVAEIALVVHCNSYSLGSTRFKCIQQAFSGVPPLTVEDYDTIAGGLLADPAGPFKSGNKYLFWFNAYGKSVIESYVGTGTPFEIGMKDYTYDYLPNIPPDQLGHASITSSEYGGDPARKPHLKFYARV